MSTQKRFLCNGILLTVVGLSIRTVNLFFNAFITRTVGAEGIGLFTLIMTLYGFAATFATAGLHLTVTRLVASANGQGDDPCETNAILRSAMLYALLFGGGAFVVLFAFARPFGLYVLNDARSIRCIRILSLSLLPSAFFTVFSGYFVGVRKIAGNATVQTMCQIFKLLFTFLCIKRAVNAGIESACVLLATVSTSTDSVAFLFGLIRFLRIRQPASANGERPKSKIGAVFGMAIPLAVSAYIRSALLTLEHILIPKCLEKHGESTASALSSYGVLHGMSLPMLLYPMATLTSFASLLVPEFSAMSAAGEKRRIERVTDKAFTATLIYSVGIAVILYLFSDELGRQIYHSERAGEYLAFLAPVVPIMYLDHVTDCILKGIGEQVYSMWVNIADSVLSVVSVWLLIPRLGLKGYALIIICMELFNFALSFLRLTKRIRIRLRLMEAVLFPGVGGVGAACLTGWLFPFPPVQEHPFFFILRMVFCGCVFLGITFALICVKERLGKGFFRGKKLLPRVI